MKRLIIVLALACGLAAAATAGAALVPGVFDPGSTGCVHSTFTNGVLHLEKNCPTATNAAAGADITGLGGQSFTSASFTLDSTAQCQGGSPRFDIVTTDGLFFLGCNNVAPAVNADGTATYTFTAATIAAGGNQVSVPTGTIQSADVLIDVEGTADLSNIRVNGKLEVPTPLSAGECKDGGWQDFGAPAFKNQGDCVSFVNTGGKNNAGG